VVASLPSTWLGKNTTIDHISQRVTYKIKTTTLTSCKHKTSNLEQFHVFSKPWICGKDYKVSEDSMILSSLQTFNMKIHSLIISQDLKETKSIWRGDIMQLGQGTLI
jgi:hypothetical protein